MLTVTITKGLPASGKSTWAKAQLAERPGTITRVNKDDLRAMLHNGRWSKQNEKAVEALRDHIIVSSLELGQHVIVDDTNGHPRHEINLRRLVKEFVSVTGKAVQVEVKVFDVGLDECLIRDRARPNPVGDTVIRRMWRDFFAPVRPVYEPAADLPATILCDLDGTLALFDGKRSPYDASRCDEVDELNAPVAEVLARFAIDHRVVLCSGRDAVHRAPTERWLARHGIAYEQLLMRAEGDKRADRIVKTELFEQHIRDRYRVVFVLDDRNQVVDAWRDLGLTVFQVAEGDF